MNEPAFFQQDSATIVKANEGHWQRCRPSSMPPMRAGPSWTAEARTDRRMASVAPRHFRGWFPCRRGAWPNLVAPWAVVRAFVTKTTGATACHPSGIQRGTGWPGRRVCRRDAVVVSSHAVPPSRQSTPRRCGSATGPQASDASACGDQALPASATSAGEVCRCSKPSSSKRAIRLSRASEVRPPMTTPNKRWPSRTAVEAKVETLKRR